MHRRRFIAAGAAAGVSLLAGCGGEETGADPGAADGESNDNGNSGGSHSGRANFENPSLQAPEEIQFGTEFELTVEVSNSGGETGEFTGTIRSTTESFEFETDVSMSVPAGETATTTTEPIAAPAVGEYEFLLSDDTEYSVTTEGDDVQTETVVDGLSGELDTTTVNVISYQLSAGEAIDIDDETQLQIDGVSFETTVYSGYDDSYPNSVIRAEAEEVYALYDVTVRSTGGDTYWDPSQIEIPGGSFYGLGGFTLFDYGENLGQRRSIDDGETVSGFFFVTCSRDAVADGAPVELQTNLENEPPEYRWTFDSVETDGFPRFERTSVDAPETVPAGESFEMSIDVTNAGEGAGTFRGLLQTVSGFSWDTVIDADPGPAPEVDIDAGATASVSFTLSIEDSGESTYRLKPWDDREWEITAR